MNKLWLWGCLMLGVTLTSACGGGGDAGTTAPPVTTPPVTTPPAVAAISVTLPVGQLVVGASTTATVLLQSSSGATLTGRAVQWTTSSASVAGVDANGVVSAVSPGSATISATSEGRMGTATVSVIVPPVATVSVSVASSVVVVGANTVATATLRDAGGAVLTGRAVAWTSSSAGIATVDANGVVIGVAPGSVTVTAVADGRSGSATVNVIPPPVSAVDVSLAQSVVTVGSSTSATVTLRDFSGNVLTGRIIAWSSSAPTVATVSAMGVVTTFAVGSVVLTATSEGKSGAVTLKVQAPSVASVVVTGSSGALNPGQTRQLVATVRDANSVTLTDRLVIWSSSNPSVASVDASGMVSALAPGAVSITATSEGRSGSVSLSVSSIVAAVTLTGTTRIKAGDTYTYTVTARAADGSVVVRPLTWSVKQSAMGSVTSGGALTPSQAGTLTLQVTIDGDVWEASYTVYDWETLSITGSNFVSLYADNQITNKYGQSEYPEVVFVCSSTGSFFSWVSTNNFITKNGTVSMLFDNGAAFSQVWDESNDFDTLFKPGTNLAVKSFASQVAAARTFGFAFTEYLGTAKAMIFRVTGLSSKLQPLLAQCPGNAILAESAPNGQSQLRQVQAAYNARTMQDADVDETLHDARATRRVNGSTASVAPTFTSALRAPETQAAVRRRP